MSYTRANGFHWNEWLPLKGILPLKRMVSTEKELFPLKGMVSTIENDFY